MTFNGKYNIQKRFSFPTELCWYTSCSTYHDGRARPWWAFNIPVKLNVLGFSGQAAFNATLVDHFVAREPKCYYSTAMVKTVISEKQNKRRTSVYVRRRCSERNLKMNARKNVTFVLDHVVLMLRSVINISEHGPHVNT